MSGSSFFRVPDWVPGWLASLLACCGLQSASSDAHAFSAALPLQGSAESSYSLRDTADETLLKQSERRSDSGAAALGGASTSGAGASRPDKPGKLLRGKHSASERRLKGLEDSRFSGLAVPSFATAARKWTGPPGLADEEVCAICLEEYDAANPQSFLTCGHAFHLG